MGDVVSSHLDESKKERISGHTHQVLDQFSRLYQQQYALALFNKVRFEVEGNQGPQSQLLHRKVPLEIKSIFSGAMYVQESKKWRIRWFYIPDSYSIECFESKVACDKGLQPKSTISCAGYKVLTSMEEYLELLSDSLPGVTAKASTEPFLKCATEFPLLLWHPYAQHYYFCLMTQKEQSKWLAVFQDCIRHSNNGLPEDSKVETPAFTDAVRLYRQAKGQYGTWDMMCGMHPQILANLVMESLVPELRNLIGPRLKGKLYQRQRNWMLILDAVYRQVLSQAQAQYEALVLITESGTPILESSIRTDMDQIITSKEHVTGKIRALVQPKAEHLLKESVQPYVSSILDALMEPTTRGFAEVRDLYFTELVEMSRNTLNADGSEKLGEHMEKVSMLAYHPVKMQSCYEKVEELQLEGLQQRFDVSSPSVFIQRAQILMRQQMDNAVYTFEQLLHQNLNTQDGEDLSKIIQRCQDRVIKKYDYDSNTVRKRFSKEALLQIIVPYMLKQLAPSCSQELPRFRELIFEDFSHFILVENIFEEVVLHSVMKDIMTAVRDAAAQRRHNLFRDSVVLTNSDPSLHLLEEKPPIDWGARKEGDASDASGPFNRRRQVVSMIKLDDRHQLPYGSCQEVPGVDDIPEEEGEEDDAISHPGSSPSLSPSPDPSADPHASRSPTTAPYKSPTPSLDHSSSSTPESSPVSSPAPVSNPQVSPDSVREIRSLINPMMELIMPASQLDGPLLPNGMFQHGDGEDEMAGLRDAEDSHSKSPSRITSLQEGGQPRETICVQEATNNMPSGSDSEDDGDTSLMEIFHWKMHSRVHEGDGEFIVDDVQPHSSTESVQCAANHNTNSGFQPAAGMSLEDEGQPISEAFKVADTIVDPGMVKVTFGNEGAAFHGDLETREALAITPASDPVSEV